MLRIFNTSDKPFKWSWNGSEYVIQPKGGGFFGAIDQQILHPWAKHPDEKIAARYAKRKITARIVKDKVLKSKQPDWLDIDEANYNFIMNGDVATRMVEELGLDDQKRMMIKTMHEVESEMGSFFEARQNELAEIEAKIRKRSEELAKLEKAAAKSP